MKSRGLILMFIFAFILIAFLPVLYQYTHQPSQEQLEKLEPETTAEDCERYYQQAKDVLKNGSAIGQTSASSAYSLLYQSCLMREALKNIEAL